MNGSSGRQRISGEEFGTFPMKRPSRDALSRFAGIGEKTMTVIRDNTNEINTLMIMQDAIRTGIAISAKGA